ncbi:MAG TPA: hypothetical protein VMV71_02885 [Candidatus Paceibacterota bacterium]|nr:hypothetical protein [Candidatus Paceibacterota bacterium]
MTAETKFDLLHPRIMQALEDLSDPEETVQKHLLKGQVAGKLSLIYSLFPPEGFVHNDVPARFTFTLEDGVVFELQLMVGFVNQSFGGEDLVFGFLRHSQWDTIFGKTEMRIRASSRWVAVKYSITRREGCIFLSKELYAVIEEFKKEALDKLRKDEDDDNPCHNGKKWLLPG